jgi:MFS family permease
MINFIINFVFTGTKIEYPFLAMGAVVGGFSGGIFGVSLNSYMNILIEIHQKKSSSGFYFGIQGMITNGCLLVGGTFSLFTGGASAQNFYYIYLFILLVSAWSFARFFINDRALVMNQ